RGEHQRLYGVIKNVDDSFWNTWLPPSDWGCKCSVQQRRNDTGSNPVPDDILLPPKNMRNNTGKTAQIFTDEHPMIKAVSKSRAVQIDKWIVDEIAKPILIKEYKNGGQYFENSLMSKEKSDYDDLSTIADLFAKQEGFKVEILPDRIHSKDIFYKYIFDGAYKNKLPDLKINGKFYEYKSYVGDWNKRKIGNMISEASKQSNRMIIDVRNGKADDRYINRIITDIQKSKINIDECWIFEENKIRIVYEKT
ncbi:MAG: hypothetical protein JXL97_11500, partial [Bacteroidales bacterium]|nr:hypothetical protein [Bacteroidales bacterium]